MKLTKVAFAFFVTMTLVSASIGVVYLQSNTFSSCALQDAQNQKMLMFSLSLVAELGVNKNLALLNQSTRMKIYDFV